MQCIEFADDIESALLAMPQGWFRCIRDSSLITAFLQGRTHLISQMCLTVAAKLSYDYINPKIFKNKKRGIDSLCCLFSEAKRNITFQIPLDASESRFFKVILWLNLSCTIEFFEPAHTTFAPMAYQMCWLHPFAEKIVVVDGREMKWKHLAFLAQGACFNFDIQVTPFLDMLDDKYKDIW